MAEERPIAVASLENAMWKAVEIKGQTHNAEDPETGAIMQVRGTPEIDWWIVSLKLPGKSEIRIRFCIEPKQGAFTGDDPTNPVIKLYVSGFIRAMQDTLRTSDEKAILVRYLLKGLAEILRRWPISSNSFIYSSLSQDIKENRPLPDFSFPSDDELAKL